MQEETQSEREEQEIENMLRNHQAQSIEPEEPVEIGFEMKPKEVKEALDKDVIGQNQAKKYLSNAVCYHYARITRDLETEDSINGADTAIKKNVLMIGNTGVGKTYLVAKIAKLIGVPFVKSDATKFSATGYVGKDVEDMVRDLYLAADRRIQLAQYGMVYIDEIDKIRSGITFGKDVSGVEVQRGLLKLMEETEVDLISNSDPLAAMQAMKEMQATNKKPTINTKHILFIMSGAFPELKDVIERRLDDEDEQWYDHITSQDLIDYGMEAEFVGRMPVRVALMDLTEEDLFNILKRSGDSITKQYMRDFLSYGILTEFTDDALRAFAHQAAQETTGARALVGIIENTLLDFMYELPSTDITEFSIDQNVVEHPRKALIELTLESNMKRFSDKFYEQNGIRLNFESEACKLISQKAMENSLGVEEICSNMLERYVHALKLYGQKNFDVVPEVVRTPEKYLKKLLKQYDE